jgi:hypothetical protein
MSTAGHLLERSDRNRVDVLEGLDGDDVCVFFGEPGAYAGGVSTAAHQMKPVASNECG